MNKTQKIIPRGKQVLVKSDGEESRELESGLVKPANEEQEKKSSGEVIAVGSEIKDIKVGDHVIYGAYSGETLSRRENGTDVEYKILFDEDVLAFLK